MLMDAECDALEHRHEILPTAFRFVALPNAGVTPSAVAILHGLDRYFTVPRSVRLDRSLLATLLFTFRPDGAINRRDRWCINRKEDYFMRKLICVAALLGGTLLPMAPPAAAQRVVAVRRHPARRGRFVHRGRWYSHRRFRRGRWHYW
jgi:hypothetical protein